MEVCNIKSIVSIMIILATFSGALVTIIIRGTVAGTTTECGMLVCIMLLDFSILRKNYTT